jgi:virginiamycin A acetyltransferase
MGRVASRIEWELRRRRQRRFMRALERRGVVEDETTRVVHTAALNPETPIRIGRGTVVHGGCVLKGTSPIAIGRYCAIAEGAHVVSSNHSLRYANMNVALQTRLGGDDVRESKGPVRIGHGVWIADNAIVLSGVTIGNGAVVAAGAVVSRDVEPFAVVAGSPASPVRKRFSDEVISALEALAWWDWSEAELRAHRELFDRDLTEDGAAAFLRRFA